MIGPARGGDSPKMHEHNFSLIEYYLLKVESRGLPGTHLPRVPLRAFS